MSATNFEQEREELNDEILQIKRTLQSMEGDEFSEDEEDEDVLCIDMDHSSGVAAGPVGSEQGTAADPVSRDDQVSSFAGSSTENSLKTVLSLNRAYQSVVKESLQRIELALHENKERQMVMKEELDQEAQEKSSKSQKNPVVSFAVPYIRDTKGMNPPPNEDALIKRQSKEGNPFIRPPKQWLARDKKKLKDAVKSDALRTHMRPLMNRKEILLAKRFETSSLANIEDIESELKQLDKDIEHIKGWSDSKLFGSRLDTSHIDWLKISSVDFDGERTAVACELMWKNAVHPSINSRKWNADEDTKLDDIVKEHGERDWAAIADQLGTNRTPFQCLQRYQTRLNPCLTTGKWTSEEDTFLLEVVGSLQESDDSIPWSQVADYLEGRSQEQCLTRWSRLKDIERTKYHTWSTEEDMKLIEAIQWFGPKSWVSVAKFVPGRNDIQCRERWTNALDTNLKIGNWSYEEDRTIWLSVQKQGVGKWVKLAERLPGRTDNMVLHRYYRMKRCRDAQDQILQIPMSKRAREATERNPPTDPVEARMIRADKAKGINIPRPVAGINARYVKKLELRRRLHEMIKLRVQRGLTVSGCTTKQLDEMLELNNNSETQTVRAMLDKSRLLQKTLSHTKGGGCKEGWEKPGRKGRQKTSGEERQVRLEIVELLQTRMGKRPCGRPRTRHVEDDTVTDTAGGKDTDTTTDTRTKIAKMFFQALQVDVPGMTKRFRDLRSKQSRVGDGRSGWASRQRHREDQLNTDIDLWEAVAMETTQPGASGDEDSCALVSLPQSCPLVAVPPNTTTLSAFKSLLLRKRTLSTIAGKKPPPKTRGRTTATPGGSTERVTTPIVRMINLHNSNMKVKEMIAIKNMIAGPTEGSTAANVPSQYYGVMEGELEEMRETRDYKRLRDRIHALFLWPALLSAISLDNLPSESTSTSTSTKDNTSTGKKRKSRFPYSRGRKYRKYLMKPAKEREVHKEICRENMAKRMDRKRQGISPDTAIKTVSGNSGDGEGKGAKEQKQEGGAPGEGGHSKRGRPRGGGKKRVWEFCGERRQTRGRSQRLANTQVAPSVDVQVAPSVSAPEGASGSETVSSTAVDGTNKAHGPVAPRVLGIVIGLPNILPSVVLTNVCQTLPPEGSVSSAMIHSPLVKVETETEVAVVDKHETLTPEGATSAETACSPPGGTAVDDQQTPGGR